MAGNSLFWVTSYRVLFVFQRAALIHKASAASGA